MYKTLEVEFIISRKMLVMINSDNKRQKQNYFNIWIFYENVS